jgi:ribose transport system permease protein
MTTDTSSAPASETVAQWVRRSSALRYTVVLAFLLVFAFLSVKAPGFLTVSNFVNILVNNFTILAIVSLAMTLVLLTGGIDLSVGTAIDLASLLFISLISAHQSFLVAIAGGLLGALATGGFNAFLIGGLRIAPFLATLGTLFIGESVQQLATNGGQPIYLITGTLAPAFIYVGHGVFFGIPFPLCLAIGLTAIFYLLTERTSFGRNAVALGANPNVAWYSGARVRSTSGLVYGLSAVTCGVAGIILSATIKAYVPLSGNAYILDAIGATFIGTTLHSEGRPGVLGTTLGVLLLSIVTNGLLLIGWNFYWQQVGTGVLIFFVLAMSFLGRRLRG